MQVLQIDTDVFRISGFLQSDPEKSCIIYFQNDVAKIYRRTGLRHDETWSKAWDEIAISNLKASLIAGL